MFKKKAINKFIIEKDNWHILFIHLTYIFYFYHTSLLHHLNLLFSQQSLKPFVSGVITDLEATLEYIISKFPTIFTYKTQTTGSATAEEHAD